MHAATAGRWALFRQVLTGITPHAASVGGAITGLRDRIHDLRACLQELGIATESTLDEEIEAAVMAIEDPGPFHSYIHGDPCPDNVFWNGRELRLIDFEFGGFGHALVDATYARMFFPTCWCANTLPGDFVRKMESVYRAELAKGCPEAQDDFTFGSALVRVCGFWMLNTLGRELGRALGADRTWGIATVRQRQMARLQAFIAAAEEHRQLPGLRSLAGRLLDVLSKVWLETSPLPLYPAFLRLEGRHGSRMG